MKDYKTITREKVDADPGAARYMSETHLLEDWSDKLLDLVLNGPTLNGFKKDELRAMLRQTYAALKQYEQIGPMASPYMNDPSAIVARAFAELYYNGRKVVPITNADGPQKFDPELEARLVKQGVAKYVDEQPVAPAPAAKPEQEPEAAPETDDAPTAPPEYDEDMKLDELKEVAAAYGVDASAMRKKADVIAAIKEAKAAANEADDDQTGDNEEPPQIGAADPV